jgi:hypothetical protein
MKKSARDVPARPEALLNMAALVAWHGRGVLEDHMQDEGPLPPNVQQLRRLVKAIMAIPGMQARIDRAASVASDGAPWS